MLPFVAHASRSRPRVFHTIGQWLAALEDTGFAVEDLWRFPLRLEFASWIERMRTPVPAAAHKAKFPHRS
jgi:hypothetical protein